MVPQCDSSRLPSQLHHQPWAETGVCAEFVVRSQQKRRVYFHQYFYDDCPAPVRPLTLTPFLMFLFSLVLLLVNFYQLDTDSPTSFFLYMLVVGPDFCLMIIGSSV